MKFETYSRESGLLQSKVYAITQDKKGFMWFGTQEGLNRFDGHTMKNYRSKPGSPDSFGGLSVFAAFTDSKGTVWFGSEKGLFAKYIPEEDSFVNYRTGGEDILTSSFCEDGRGNLLIGSYGAGLFILRNGVLGGKTIERVDFPESLNLSCLCKGRGGKIFAGTFEGGLYRLQTEDRYGFRVDGKVSTNSNAIRCIYEDSRGRLIVGTAEGLNFIHGDGNAEHFSADGKEGSLPYNVVTDIAEDKENVIWIATRNGGLSSFDERERKFTVHRNDPQRKGSLPDNSIHCIYVDRSNVLWAGTVSSGVCRSDLDAKPFRNPSDTNTAFTEFKNVNCILEDSRGKIFIGTHNKGVLVTDRRFVTFERYHRKSESEESRLPGNSVYSICETGDSRLFFGVNNGGLIEFDRATSRFISHFPESEERFRNIFSIIADPLDSNRLIIAADKGGMCIFDTRKNRIEKGKFTDIVSAATGSSINKSLYSEPDGTIWFSATSFGLMKINSSRNQVRRISDYDSRFADGIRHISGNGDGTLLISTSRYGLIIYDPVNGVRAVYDEASGLASDSVMSAISDMQGSIWAGTLNGLSRIDSYTGKITNYYESDNLSGREHNETAVCMNQDGMLLFGGAEGLTYFFPSEILDNPFKPEMVITEFQIFNTPVEAGRASRIMKKSVTCAEEIELSYRHSVFSFEYSALIFNDPSKNKYAYKLEGFDKGWNFCGDRRFATYTNIEPGEYVFKVAGTNNDGFWCDEPAQISVRIKPPFWDTWWFKTGAAITSVAAAAGAYSLKMQKIRKEKEQQDEFSRKLLESQEVERKRIASDLHDTIAHDILVMKNKAYIGMTRESDPGNLKEVLKEISELSSDALGDVRGISYNLHPHKIERLGLSKALKSMLSYSEQSSGISFEADIADIDGRFSKDFELNIFRMVQELANNVIKHSEAKNVFAEISTSDTQLLVIFQDDGVGFPANFKPDEQSGLGISGIKTRARLYGGTVEFRTPETGGGTVKIRIPIESKTNETSQGNQDSNS